MQRDIEGRSCGFKPGGRTRFWTRCLNVSRDGGCSASVRRFAIYARNPLMLSLISKMPQNRKPGAPAGEGRGAGSARLCGPRPVDQGPDAGGGEAVHGTRREDYGSADRGRGPFPAPAERPEAESSISLRATRTNSEQKELCQHEKSISHRIQCERDPERVAWADSNSFSAACPPTPPPGAELSAK